MVELGLGVFAVWIVWQVAEYFLEARQWVWWLLLVAGGVAWQCAFINWSYWWLGLGVGGAAAFLGKVADLMLLAGDAARVAVLRNSRSS